MGVKAGESYVDTGTFNGYRAAMGLLEQAQSAERLLEQAQSAERLLEQAQAEDETAR